VTAGSTRPLQSQRESRPATARSIMSAAGKSGGYSLNMLPSCRQRTGQLALRKLSRSVVTSHDRDSTRLPTTMTTWTAQSPTLPAQPASARCKASSGTEV